VTHDAVLELDPQTPPPIGDGRFVMFTSNWDGVGPDVYILRVPTICGEP
jgi:hypothetical protein